MLLNFTDMLYAFSFALDAVEKEYRNVLDGHGMRVAWMCENMGRTAGMDAVQLIHLTSLAILHDNPPERCPVCDMPGSGYQLLETHTA